MSNKVKDVDIKNCTYYFFNDIIDIKDFDPNNIKIDEKSQKALVYYIRYVTIKKYKIRKNLQRLTFVPYFQQLEQIL